MAFLAVFLKWLVGHVHAQAPGDSGTAGTPGHPARRIEDFVGLLDRHPGMRSTTLRILGGRATDDGTLFVREHIETTDDAGNARQVEVFAARTCGFGHVLDEHCHAAGICGVCGELLCSTEHPTPCTSVCQSCGTACCARDRNTYNLGDGKIVTYCSRCSWRFWFW